MLEVAIINSGEMFFNSQMLTFFMCFHLMFTPYLAKRSFPISSLWDHHICLAKTPLALFFPELGAEGSLSPHTTPRVQVEWSQRADYPTEFAGIWLVIIIDFLCDLIPSVATATAK